MKPIYIIAANAPLLSPEAVDLLIAGRAEARGGYAQGQLIPHRLSEATRPIYEQAMARGWLEMPRKCDALRNAWWAWCEAHRHPFVYTQGAGKLTEVHMDLVCFPDSWNVSRRLDKPLRNLCAPLSKRRSFFVGCFTSVFVDPHEAPGLAESLLAHVWTAAAEKEEQT